MTLALTSSISTLVDYQIDLLRSKINDLGVHKEEDIYYGAQDRYPRYPSIAVEPGPRDSPLYQTGLQQNHQFTVFLLCVHAQIGSIPDLRRKTDEFAESVIDVLHADAKMGGLVVHGHVMRVEPGFTLTRGGALLSSSRLRWEGISRTRVGG